MRPVRYEQLLEVVDIWVETAMRIGKKEIRLMERLARSQERLTGGGQGPLVPRGEMAPAQPAG